MLAACCAPYHGGLEAPDAETLMRSRFTAFAVRDWAYLWRTLHPDHVDRRGEFAKWSRGAAAGAQGASFRSLQILDVAPADGEGLAHVLFMAEVFVGSQDVSFLEHSRFARDGAGWRYLDGRTLERGRMNGPLEFMTFARFEGLYGS